MNVKMIRFGTKQAVRHPRLAMRLSAMALRYRGAIATASNMSREGSRVAANPKIRAETRLALLSLVRARTRAQKIGLEAASSDRRVTAELSRATRHAGKALKIARRSRRRHRAVRKTTVVVGAGALGGATYLGWKRRAQAQRPVEGPPDTIS
jgi:hypothetical protein